MHISGKAFIVTGGSSGLGAACVEALQAAGGRVLIADVNQAVGQELAERLGDGVRYLQTNVTSEDNVKAAVAMTLTQFGRLDGVVNCAGVVLAQRVLGKEGPHDLAAFDRVLRINVLGGFNVIRLAAEVMARNEPNDEGEHGVIINTASVAAYDGQIGQAAYAASKAAIAGMTLPLARDLARHGIRVMSIAPGTFDTPMLAGLPDAARQSLAQQVPFPSRLGRPQEFAALAIHIIQNAMLNGEVIRLDGAMRMGPK